MAILLEAALGFFLKNPNSKFLKVVIFSITGSKNLHTGS